MKKQEYSDSVRKKVVGEHLRNADKFLKAGEYDAALTEVDKSLELDPGNFYAQAYRDRITSLQSKAVTAVPPRQAAPSPAMTTGTAAGTAEPADATRAPQPAGPADGHGDTPGTSGSTDSVFMAEEPQDDSSPAPAPQVPDLVDGIRAEQTRKQEEREKETLEAAGNLVRAQLQEELKRAEATERFRVAEQAAIRDALLEAKSEAAIELTKRCVAACGEAIGKKDPDELLVSLGRLRALSPKQPEIATFTAALKGLVIEKHRTSAVSTGKVPDEIRLTMFERIVAAAWVEGPPNDVQNGIVEGAKARFGITPEEEGRILVQARLTAYSTALRDAYRNGDPPAPVQAFLKHLEADLSLTPEQVASARSTVLAKQPA